MRASDFDGLFRAGRRLSRGVRPRDGAFPHEGHDYGPSKRMAAYPFFIRYLGLDGQRPWGGRDGAIDESFVTIESRQQMLVFGPENHALNTGVSMTEDKKLIISRVEMGVGWVLLVPSQEGPPEPEQTPTLLHRTLCKWLKQNPHLRVRATVPIVEQGNTMAIHVWFD